MILIPKYQDIIMPPMPMRFGIVGRMRLQTINKFSGKMRLDTGWFKNMVVNQGLDALAQQSDCLAWFHVGTGSTPPTVDDTWLEGFVASTNTLRTESFTTTTGVPYYGWKRITRRFNAGVAAGNLSEAAVGWSNAVGTVFARQLIRDEFGDPTTITVLSDEFLDFSYELRYIVPTTDYTGTVTISGATYDVIGRAASCTNATYWASAIGDLYTINAGSGQHMAYTGNIRTVTEVPIGESGTGTTTATAGTYGTGTYYRDFTVTGSPSQWNVTGGIRSLVLTCNSNRWQAQFNNVSDDSTIPKTVSNSLTMVYRTAWARA